MEYISHAELGIVLDYFLIRLAFCKFFKCFQVFQGLFFKGPWHQNTHKFHYAHKFKLLLRDLLGLRIREFYKLVFCYVKDSFDLIGATKFLRQFANGNSLNHFNVPFSHFKSQFGFGPNLSRGATQMFKAQQTFHPFL
jgi:hypothetical protein